MQPKPFSLNVNSSIEFSFLLVHQHFKYTLTKRQTSILILRIRMSKQMATKSQTSKSLSSRYLQIQPTRGSPRIADNDKRAGPARAETHPVPGATRRVRPANESRADGRQPDALGHRAAGFSAPLTAHRPPPRPPAPLPQAGARAASGKPSPGAAAT